jgi:uncharacterized protein (DUF169 family)
MSKNKEYAKILQEIEGIKRRILAFKLLDEVPESVEPYGDDVSFHCAIVAEAWEEGRKPFYVTKKNVICGGALYSGIGNVKVTNKEFEASTSQFIGINKGFATREALRRSTQQIYHFFKSYQYQVIGALEDIEDPDVVMVVADAYRVMRLIKAYSWKTGELVHGISGSGWCTNSFSLVYKTKTMTYNMGDETSRVLMNLDPGEMYCFIHYNLLPLVVENYKNIQTGLEM